MSVDIPYKHIIGYQKIIDYLGYLTDFHDDPIIDFSHNGTEIEFVISTQFYETPEEKNLKPVDVRIKCHNVIDYSFDVDDLSCMVLSELRTEKKEDGNLIISLEGFGGDITCSSAEAFIEPVDVTKNRYPDIKGVENIFTELGEYPRFRDAIIYHNDNTSVSLEFHSNGIKREITISYSDEEINCDYDDTKHRFKKFLLTELWTRKTPDGYVIIDMRGTGYSIKCKNPFVSKIE